MTRENLVKLLVNEYPTLVEDVDDIFEICARLAIINALSINTS